MDTTNQSTSVVKFKITDFPLTIDPSPAGIKGKIVQSKVKIEKNRG